MNRQLDYFTIGESFGGNQEWFSNVVMYIGGCGAAAACDSCIYFARQMELPELYPYDMQDLTQEDYKRFSQIMKPYIRPRVGGVKKLEWYIEGLNRYIQDVNEKGGVRITLPMEGFSGTRSWEEAKKKIRCQIGAGYPVPYLLLKHKDTEQYKDFIWHWFLVVGCEDQGEDLKITVATYGKATHFSLKDLWDSGYEEKGGLILYGEIQKV